MSEVPQFIMIGGFLGAGKTTTIAMLAERFQRQGKRVAIVTNDQAADLVDTLLLRSKGYDVGEVAGSCFCCNFDGLTGAMESLASDQLPDVVLAEPVGSCTDLVATVLRPLEQIYQKPFRISPYGVIIKPSHGFKILGGEGQRGFSPKAEYIFRKQIEEADFVIVNRIDELSAEQVATMEQLLQAAFPQVPVIRMSAKTGDGMDEVMEHLNQPVPRTSRTMEVDYDIYAEGEAELGWLNCQSEIQSSAALNIDAYLMRFMNSMHALLTEKSAEVAHLKVIGMAEGVYAVANLVSNADVPRLSLPGNWQGREFDLVVNARVAMAPEELEPMVRTVLQEASGQFGAIANVRSLQCFRPGRPVPTHRLTHDSV